MIRSCSEAKQSIWTNFSQVRLSRLKETVAPEDLDSARTSRSARVYYYPFALALRLRVLQIVFGIIFLIMGAVAFIEERGDLNLSLGIPTGVATVVAAAASIHTSRGFDGYKSRPACSFFRFLGPSLGVGVPVALLWGTACSFLAALGVQCLRTLRRNDQHKDDLFVLAVAELALALVTLSMVAVHLRIDCKYDPD